MNVQILNYIKKFDLLVSNWISHFRNENWNDFFSVVSNIGSPFSFFLLTIVLCMFFWLYKKPYHLILFLFSVGVSSVAVFLLKIIIERPRPIDALIHLKDFSFPSGHATISTVFCFLIIYSYKKHFKNKFFKYLFFIFFILIWFAISFSRVYLGVHYFSDVFMGVLIGLFVSSISVMFFENFSKTRDLL